MIMLKRSSLFLLLFCFATITVAAQSSTKESNLKAAFIYNFTQYIEWENNVGQDEFIIGIIGSSTLSRPISEIARTRLAKNRKIVLKHFSSPEEITYCNILFIPRSCPFPLSSVLEKTGKGVLTISEEPGLASLGTAINFVIKNSKLKFEINLKSIYTAGLKASSQLLKLAIITD